MEILKRNEKKEEMTRQEAYDLIREWGDILENKLKDEDFEAVQEQLWLAVVKERLTFNKETEIFTYALKKPIVKKDGSGNISILKIEESDGHKKRGFNKYNDDMDTNAALTKAYCTDSEGNQIEHGFLTRIKDRDNSNINAVILGFFLQVVPGSK